MRFNYVLLSSALLMFPVSNFASTDASISEQDISANIVGGESTTLNQLPFFARLILHKTGENQFSNICGGSIVNDRFILTAAHCVQSDTFTDGWTTEDLHVLVKNPTMDDVYVSEFKDVSQIIIHPDYDESDLWINDIALLELSTPITDNVQSITLPQDFGDYSDASVYQIFGLGKTSTSDEYIATYLRWAEVKPLSDSECADMVSGFHSQESLCATGFENRVYSGVCLGDSGGPLTYVDEEGMYQQIGIVSYGSSVCESAEIPSVFTELLNYTSWLEEKTSTGVATSYDATLAATESYHSAGDSENVEDTTTIDENDSDNTEETTTVDEDDSDNAEETTIGDEGDNDNGGALDARLLLLGSWLGWIRRRKSTNA